MYVVDKSPHALVMFISFNAQLNLRPSFSLLPLGVLFCPLWLLLLLLLLPPLLLLPQSFATFWQFLVALLTLPLALTLSEAFSPHTMDTPFIMGVGGAMLYAIITLL